MFRRFDGKSNIRVLEQVLGEQFVVEHRTPIAKALASVSKIQQLETGAVLIEQDGCDNEIHFILSGAVDIFIKRRKIATREAGLHVGEMALIDPQCKRSATVIAIQQTVVATVSEAAFSELAKRYPCLWRRLALELGNRLRQRSRSIQEPHACPVVFIGSSKEGLPVAQALARGLRGPKVMVRIWSKGVFLPSQTAVEALEEQTSGADFAILVASPDDMTTSRGSRSFAPRDNVLLEFGMFMGALKRQRTYLLWPLKTKLRLPSDLLGVTTIRYESGTGSGRPDVREACRILRERIGSLGPR